MYKGTCAIRSGELWLVQGGNSPILLPSLSLSLNHAGMCTIPIFIHLYIILCCFYYTPLYDDDSVNCFTAEQYTVLELCRDNGIMTATTYYYYIQVNYLIFRWNNRDHGGRWSFLSAVWYIHFIISWKLSVDAMPQTGLSPTP